MKFKETVDFIQSQFDTKGTIPLHRPVFLKNEKKYVLDTIESTFVSSVGAYVDLSEKLVSDFCKIDRAIAVVNGTSGLHIGLKLVGVKAGEEVITQALSFVATANAISYTGAEPIFLDVDYDTMGLSAKAVSDFLNENAEITDAGTFNKLTGKRIAACVPMHTFGFPVHMNQLIEVCTSWAIPIVEDAAESVGSYYFGKHLGSFGELGVFSFNGNKIITSGGGGMIVSNNMELAREAKHITTTAKLPHPYEFIHDMIGYNYRMPNLNAALLCAQLEQLNLFIESKRQLANEYYAFFNSRNIKFRKELKNTEVNYWLMCIELESIDERNEFLRYTNELGVTTRPIWKLLYKLPMFSNCFKDSQKNAQILEQCIVNIPSSARL